MTTTPNAPDAALLPCPFCGDTAELRTSTGGLYGYSFGCRAMCEACGVSITYEGSDLASTTIKAQAIAAWLTRRANDVKEAGNG